MWVSVSWMCLLTAWVGLINLPQWLPERGPQGVPVKIEHFVLYGPMPKDAVPSENQFHPGASVSSQRKAEKRITAFGLNGRIYHIQAEYFLDRTPDMASLSEQTKALYGEPEPGLFSREIIWKSGNVSFRINVRREKVTLVLSDTPTVNAQLAKVH
ncbi:MAG: hypothetical protein KDC71_21885 [Acidobacteria bacterium]|nr:hypothetical protein [Acidobacteriota bacterium]